MQLNSYAQITSRHRGERPGDPFELLAEHYPAEALEAMTAHYRPAPVPA